MARKGQLRLGAFHYLSGHHIAAWRHPEASSDSTLEDLIRFARLAEDAKFDAVFLADSVDVRLMHPDGAARKAHTGISPFEPLTLLSALAAVTSRIGLIGTASTTFSDPFNLARQFASLDHVSKGRAGWNLVTSNDPEAALNFGHTAPVPHAQRYQRAEEFADVVRGLWDSFEDDAFARDRASGLYFHLDRMHVLDHAGAHFRVKGPLNVPRSPQGNPVVVQAGSSEPGKELAARTAEVIFTAQQTLEEARTFYADVKGRLARYGRDHDDLKIMPGVFPVVGRTRQEAQDKFDQLQALLQPEVGFELLRVQLGVDLRGCDPDGPLPELPPTLASQSRQALVADLARRENLTIRQLYERIAGARGHWQLVGTGADIADALEERFVNFGADGFNLMSPVLPGGLIDFIERVLPELRRRGLFRTEYDGVTLREHLGLKRPPNGLAARKGAPGAHQAA